MINIAAILRTPQEGDHKLFNLIATLYQKLPRKIEGIASHH